MLEELLSVLPYNPSLIHQLGFYSKRARAEQNIRRIGLAFLLLAFFVQFFVFISPPQQTVADSTNDLVNGGFNSAAEAAYDCSHNIQGYGTILANYGITCAKVASAPSLTIASTDFNRQLFSMGRLPYGIAGETPVNIDGSTFYVRYLWGWDTGPPSHYEALNVTSAGGQTFFLLYACGNLTSVGMPQPVAPKPTPPPPVTKHPGQGTVPGCPEDSSIPETSSKCVVCKYNSKIIASSPECKPSVCKYNNNISSTSPDCKPPVCQYNKNILASSPNCKPPVCQYDTSILASNNKCVPCEYNRTIIASNSQCKSCTESLSSQDTIACIVVHKTAANLTQGITNANGTTAQPNDVILYTLYADNVGKGTVKNYVFQENLSDVLNYSNVDNLYGGKMNSEDIVTWPAVTIAGGKTVTEKLAVKVMSVIPQTPISSSDPDDFNLTMVNVYGNTITIHVPGSPAKTIETTAANLPNTGPGTSIFIAAVIVVFAGYFFARSRLLATEANMAIKDSVNGSL